MAEHVFKSDLPLRVYRTCTILHESKHFYHNYDTALKLNVNELL